MKKNIACFIILFIIGVILFGAAWVIWFVFPLIVHQQVDQLLPLHNDTLVYNQWKETSLPVYMSFYLFNVVNKAEVEDGGRPFVEQVGPYIYREVRIKHNITFFENGTVGYKQKRYFYFDENLSKGSLSDTITTVNIPMLVIGNMIQNFPKLIKEAINIFLKTLENVDVFMDITVEDLIWGYEDPILKKFQNLLKTFGMNVDPIIGLFYGKNATDDGEYIVDSGRISLDNFLKISSWNGSNHLNMWNSKYANMLNGTDGSMFPPFLNKSRLYTFQSDLCRSIYAEYTKSVTVKGIPSYQYEAPAMLFANHTVNPDNEGFCLDGVCLGSGVLNMSQCIPNAPVVMSQPHFYQADPKYHEAVGGLLPGSDELGTKLQMEPTTGLPINLQKKLQINLAVKPVIGFAKMDKLRTLYLPVVFVNESAIIDDELADQLKSMLIRPQFITKLCCVIGMIIGFMLIISFAIGIVMGCFKKDQDPSINNSDNTTRVKYEMIDDEKDEDSVA